MYKYANSHRENRKSCSQIKFTGSKIDTGCGKSLVEAQQRKNDQKDYDTLK